MRISLRAITIPPTKAFNPMGYLEYLIEVRVSTDEGSRPETADFVLGKDTYGDVLIGVAGPEETQELTHAAAFDKAPRALTP